MPKNYSQDELAKVRDQHEQWLMSQPGVLGTSVGLSSGGDVCLRIFTQGTPKENRQAVKNKLGDVPIDWEETEGVMPYRAEKP